MISPDGPNADGLVFNPAAIYELQELPPEEKEEAIQSIMDGMSEVIRRAEAEGFLFEMITSWSRPKVASFEATIIYQQVMEETMDDLFGDYDE